MTLLLGGPSSEKKASSSRIMAWKGPKSARMQSPRCRICGGRRFVCRRANGTSSPSCSRSRMCSCPFASRSLLVSSMFSRLPSWRIRTAP